jgi:hypothetical protein
MAAIPHEFFTLESMLTLTGASGATFVMSNGLQKAFNFSPKWLGLAVAMFVSMGGVAMSGGAGSDYFVGFVNAFLIYATASGVTSAAAGPAKANRPRGDVSTNAPPRSFFTPWTD